LKWSDHRSYAARVGAQIGMSPCLEKEFLAGSIAPDEERAQGDRHHPAPVDTIMAEARAARVALLAHQHDTAARHLGRLLHYVQDTCILSGDLHDEVERGVSELNPVLDLAIGDTEPPQGYRSLKAYVASMRAPEPVDDWQLYLTMVANEAAARGVVAARSLISRSPPPPRLVGELEECRRRRHAQVKCVSAWGFTAGIVLALLKSFLITSIPWWAILLPLLSWPFAAIATSDCCQDIEYEALWFGISASGDERPPLSLDGLSGFLGGPSGSRGRVLFFDSNDKT